MIRLNDLNDEDTEEYFLFLDRLYESGKVNMNEARPYLQREFPYLSKREARNLLTDWEISRKIVRI